MIFKLYATDKTRLHLLDVIQSLFNYIIGTERGISEIYRRIPIEVS